MSKKMVFTIQSKDTLRDIMMNIWEAVNKGIEGGPVVVELGRPDDSRSARQNRLQFQWYKDAEDQGDMTAEEYRAYCKLHFGVGILKEENDDFAMQYDELIRPLEYEEKIALMKPPIDLPVTSLMKTKGMSKYLNAVWNHFTGLGIKLTDPQMMGLDDGY